MSRWVASLRTRVLAPWWWAQRAIRNSGREREGVVQAVKMALAAVLAWLAARWIPSPQAFIAPYAAVFLMSQTVYRTLTTAVQQVAALVVGVFLAFVVASLINQPVVALGVAVLVGMLLGQWNRLGDSGIWIGIAALLMLTYGTADHSGYLFQRIAETVLGAVVGVSVNMFVLPPVHLRQSKGAVAALADEVRDLVQTMAGGLRDGWQHADARSWLGRARALLGTISRADDRLALAMESTRFNARWRLLRRGDGTDNPSRYAPALNAFREISMEIQQIAKALVADSDTEDGSPQCDDVFCAALADTLESIADAASCYHDPQDSFRDKDLDDQLDRLRETHDKLAGGAERDRTESSRSPNTRGAVVLALDRAIHGLDEHRPRKQRR